MESEPPRKRLKANLDVNLIGGYREYQYRVTTNEQGFRRSTPYELNDASNYAILILGDSQTFGAGVNDGQTFSSLLSARLKQMVLNAGVPGYNTIEESQLAQNLLSRYSPKWVILGFYVGNDPYENFRNRKALTAPEAEQIQAPAARAKRNFDFSFYGVKDFLKRNSSLYNGFARLRRFRTVNDLLYQLHLVQQEPPGELGVYQKNGRRQADYWEITAETVAKLHRLTKQNGVELLIVLIPDRLQIDTEYQNQWAAKYRLRKADYDFLQFNKRLEIFCQENHISLVDASDYFDQSYKEGINPFWSIDHHLSPAGHKLIAELIYQFLERG